MADEPQETPASGAPEPAPSKPEETPEETVAALRKALERANKEAEKARVDLKVLKPLADRAQALEDASKSELEKLTESANTAKAEAAAATAELQRLQVALDKVPAGTDMATVRSIARRLQGGTQEELEADAAELVAMLLPASTTGGVGGHPGRPVEQLKPGALPIQQDRSLTDQIAAAETAGNWSLSTALKTQLARQLPTP